MAPVTIVQRDSTSPLAPAESDAVVALALGAAEADGSMPLSEAFRLAVQSPVVDGVEHLLAYAAGGSLVGYAQGRRGARGESPSAELVVAPDARRRGVGTTLVDRLPQDVRIWSHGAGALADAAARFAGALGLVPVRHLHVMGRALQSGEPWPAATLPEGYAVRTFERGRDENAWLALNAAAFAHHPEQGSMVRADLEQRIAEPWWDPAGLILVVDSSDPDRLAASHWTKVDPPDGDVGEVYVVAVSPDRQGQGLGRAVTILGLDHLRSLGLDRVVLYVDEENLAAVRTYRGLGFEDVEVHQQFARGSEALDASEAPEASQASERSETRP
jgi:mycothiol synthase